MKVLITGAGGQVGWELQQTRPEGIKIIALHRSELDITDRPAVTSVIAKLQPDLQMELQTLLLQERIAMPV